MNDIKALLERRISCERAKDLLVALVKVPSPQTELLEDEPLLKVFITSAIEPRLRTMGFSDICYDPMSNLIATYGAGASGKSLMLIGNAMNQPAATMPNPYAGDVVDGATYGLPLLRGIERDAGISLGADIGFLGDALVRAGQGDLVGEGRERMRRAHGIDPGAVLFVHPKHRGRDRFHDRLAPLHRGGDRFPNWLGGLGRYTIAAFRHEGVEEDDRADGVAHRFGHARNDNAAVGMADKHDVVEVFPLDDVDGVGHVGGEIDLTVDEVRALAQARHRRREHLVPALLQKVGDASPAPAAVPSAVHQHERIACAGLCPCRRSAQRRCARAGSGACQHAAPGHRRLIGMIIVSSLRIICSS
jgi:hypothetical protein